MLPTLPTQDPQKVRQLSGVSHGYMEGGVSPSPVIFLFSDSCPVTYFTEVGFWVFFMKDHLSFFLP